MLSQVNLFAIRHQGVTGHWIVVLEAHQQADAPTFDRTQPRAEDHAGSESLVDIAVVPEGEGAGLSA
jgi:hypothetical protein